MYKIKTRLDKKCPSNEIICTYYILKPKLFKSEAIWSIEMILKVLSADSVLLTFVIPRWNWNIKYIADFIYFFKLQSKAGIGVVNKKFIRIYWSRIVSKQSYVVVCVNQLNFDYALVTYHTRKEKR